MAVASLIGAAGLAAGLWVRSPAERGDDLRSTLLLAMGGVRPVEGRLAGFARAPYRPSAKLQSLPALAEAARSVRRRLGRLRSAEALADAALLEIAGRRWGQAALLLGEAAGGAHRHAGQVNDLAVVYLAQAVEEGRPERLVLALATIEKALQLAPALPEAAFNRALIMERLGLREHARSGWRQYLGTEGRSGWADEARSRLAALDAAAADSWNDRHRDLERATQAGPNRRAAAIVRRYTQSARVSLEVEVLVRWARAVQLRDETGAAAALRSAEAVAAGLREVSEDRLPGEAVAAIQAASGPRRDLLARAHLDFGEAYSLYKRDAFGAARERLASAREGFQQARSPFSAWADFYLAACDYREERGERAVLAALALSRDASARSYLNVAGRAEWMLGLIALEQASPNQALDHLRQALSCFERTHELGNQGAIASLIANALDYLGDPGEGWRFRDRAVQASLAAGDDDRLPVIYGAAARALMKQGELSAALAYQDEALGLARAARDPLISAESYWWRAMILHTGGQDERAAQDVARARSWAARIADPPRRQRTLAGISVIAGAVQRAAMPRESIAALSRALSQYRTLSYSYLLVDIYWERALSFLALGDFDAAERDLAAGIEEFERQRARVHDLELQASYFDRADRIVEAMISFQLDRRRDPERAFDFAERSKARTLLDLSSRTEARGGEAALPRDGDHAPATAALVRRRLPAGTYLLQYAVLRDRLLIWCHRSGGGTFRELPVDRRTLDVLVEQMLSATARAASPDEVASPSEVGSASERLFGLLLEPVLASLPEQASLVIVPDKTLEMVPFPALRERRSGRFLIERNPLTTAPSASVFLRSLDRASRLPSRRQTAMLAVGNPALDGSAHGQLSRLADATDEALAVAAMYRDSRALLGGEATVSRFLSLVNHYDLVHYSGHAIPDGASPLAASLLLAPGRDGSSGDLTAREIQDLRLTRPRLIVLAACGTAAGSRRDLEGVSHLARAFLAAGAPAVVANLWNVGDSDARAFFAVFYSELEARRDPMRALQATQTRMIHSPAPELRSPSAWAGFQLIGAVGSTEAISQRRRHG